MHHRNLSGTLWNLTASKSATSTPEATALSAADWYLYTSGRGTVRRTIGDLRPLWKEQLHGDARTGDSWAVSLCPSENEKARAAGLRGYMHGVRGVSQAGSTAVSFPWWEFSESLMPYQTVSIQGATLKMLSSYQIKTGSRWHIRTTAQKCQHRWQTSPRPLNRNDRSAKKR